MIAPFLLFLVLAYVYGVLPFILLKSPLPKNPITPVWVGFAVLGILSQWFLLGGAINFFVLLVLLVGATAAIWRYPFYYQTHSLNVWRWLKSLSAIYQSALLITFALLLYHSAVPTKIHDMAAYYLQTLQWMQQVGVVRGLGNLYPALGLGSAWHSLLSMVQIPNLPAFYGINGVLLFTAFLWLLFQFLSEPMAIEIAPNPAAKLQAKLYPTDSNHRFTKVLPALQKVYLMGYGLSLFPLGFLYLTAPSPDLPLLVFTPLLLYFTLLDTKSLPAEITLILACFLFTVKPPALLAIVVGAYAVLQSFQKFEPKTLGQLMEQAKKPWQQSLKLLSTRLLIALFCLSPVIAKNVIQTGYILYPLGDLGFEEKLWKFAERKRSPDPLGEFAERKRGPDPSGEFAERKRSPDPSGGFAERKRSPDPSGELGGLEDTAQFAKEDSLGDGGFGGLNQMDAVASGDSLRVAGFGALVQTEPVSVFPWKIPGDWNRAYRQGIVAWGYTDSVPTSSFSAQLPGTQTRFITWLTRPGYKGFMNMLLLLNFVWACVLCLTHAPNSWRLFHTLLIALSIVEWFFLSQYRLMLPLALSLFCFNSLRSLALWPKALTFIQQATLQNKILLLQTAFLLTLTFVPMSAFKEQSRNQSITQTDGFKTDYLIHPHTHYAHGELDSTALNIGHVYFYHNKTYPWNAPIPAVSKGHARFLKQHFNYHLIRLGPKLEDGFALSR